MLIEHRAHRRIGFPVGAAGGDGLGENTRRLLALPGLGELATKARHQRLVLRMILHERAQHLQLLIALPEALELAGIGKAELQVLVILLPFFGELGGLLDRGD